MKRINCFVIILLLIGVDSNSGQTLPGNYNSEEVKAKTRANKERLDSSLVRIDSIMYFQKELQRALRNEMYMAVMPENQ